MGRGLFGTRTQERRVGRLDGLISKPGVLFALLALALPAAGATHTHASASGATPIPAVSTDAFVAPGSADEAFLLYRDAIKLGTPDLTALAARVAQIDPNYPLLPYVEYYGLSQALRDPAQTVPAATVEDFRARYAGTLVADYALHDWLLALGHRADFDGFDAEYPALVLHDDPQVECFALLARYQRLEKHASPIHEPLRDRMKEALAQPRDIGGEGCTALAQALVQDGHIGPEELWAWSRHAAEVDVQPGFQAYLALLPERDRVRPEVVDAIFDKPALWLARRANERVSDKLVVLALTRMARSAPDQTVTQFERSWERRLSGSDNGIVWAELGAAASRRLMPDALPWCRRALDVDGLSSYVLSSCIRAALHEQNWPLVALFIEKLPAAERAPEAGDGAWAYWLARAYATQGRTDDAQALYAGLLQRYSFYGQLAAEELGRPLALPPQAVPPTDDEVLAVSQRQGFARARKFYDLGLRYQGNVEWNFTLTGMSDRELLASAEWARRLGLYDRAVNTAEKTQSEHDFALRFLAPYREAMEPKAVALKLDLDWVYGLIRQESRFVTEARSVAGAKGLMQLMPATARYVARRMGMVEYRPEQVADMDTNLMLGTNYLRLVLDQLDGDEVLATAAYNAGPGRSRSWRALLSAPVEGALFAETIPFTETRDYVKRVMSNAVYYNLVFDPTTKASLKARLGTISPASAGATSDLP